MREWFPGLFPCFWAQSGDESFRDTARGDVEAEFSGDGRPERGDSETPGGGSRPLTGRAKNSACSKAVNNRNGLWI